jgi:hypothetical protein
MSSRKDDRKKPFAANLDKLRIARDDAAAQKRALLEKLAAKSKAVADGKSSAGTKVVAPSAAAVLPAMRLYHRSDLAMEVAFVPAAAEAASVIASSIATRENGVVFTWPDKINRPLGVTISALLRAQSVKPRLQATVAYFPFSDRKIHSLKSIFVDDDDLAARYQKLITNMDRAEYGSIEYKNAYLLKGLKSAQPSKTGAGKPNLRELVPVFPYRENHYGVYFADADDGFLGEIASKRTLIKEAQPFRRLIASKQSAPIAIFGLPDSIEAINRLFKNEERLRDHCDLIVADATDVSFGGASSAWLKGLSRLAHIASGHACHPPILVITQDAYIAKTSSEIIGSARTAQPQKRAPVRSAMKSLVKIVPNDFSAHSAQPAVWTPVDVAVILKEESLAEFRTVGLALAKDLRHAGYPSSADAVVAAITFVRTIACLPVALNVLRDHLDLMEQAGAVSAFVAAPYRYQNVAHLLRRAENHSDSMGDLIGQFRERVEAKVERYAPGGEVVELVRDLLGKAIKKANRTVVAFRDRVVLSAFTTWLEDQTEIDAERFDSKVILTTTEALASTLSAASRGAPIDTLLLVCPTVRHLERIILSPALPRKVLLIGDAGSLGALDGILGPVAPLLSAAPADRLKSVLKGLKACSDRFQSFDFEKVIAPEFDPEMTLDFTVQDSTDAAYTGPIVELLTEDGYLLRLLPQADCLVLQDGDANPLRRVRAENVREGERIFIFGRALHDRLESLLGPVQPEGATLLSAYHNAVRDRVALIAGNRQEQAREIVRRMKEKAAEAGGTVDLGIREQSNVIRWMTASGTGGRPDAPRSPSTFAAFMVALDVPEIISAQYWNNAVVSARIMAIQVGLHAHSRAQEFVLNPHGFYSRFPIEKPELRQLWEEMVRSAGVVTRKNIVAGTPRKETT